MAFNFNVKIQSCFTGIFIMICFIYSCKDTEQYEKRMVKEAIVSFKGIPTKWERRTTSDGLPKAGPFEVIWKTTITDSHFIESINSLKEWKTIPDVYCVRNTQIVIVYYDDTRDTFTARITPDEKTSEKKRADECDGLIDYHFGKNETLKCIDNEYVFRYLRKLFMDMPNVDGWRSVY